jgi:pantoate--beta-alanine ligase
MNIVECPARMREAVRAIRQKGERIALVPTMGFLHEGHLSLIRIARRNADRVVVSLFVNPLQFGPNEDLDRYPRDRARDEALCRGEGADILFCPDAAGLYAPDASTTISESRLSRGLCGESRPGHFRGVCTVVAKLFHLCDPAVAVFGEKDAQQLRVIERMVRDLNFPVRILRGPIVREPDGLAMSSRNARLSPEARRQATCLRCALDRAEALAAGGERSPAVLVSAMREILDAAPLARTDYIQIVAEDTLEPLGTLDRPALVALAVCLGDVRLIDNTPLPPQRPG